MVYKKNISILLVINLVIYANGFSSVGRSYYSLNNDGSLSITEKFSQLHYNSRERLSPDDYFVQRDCFNKFEESQVLGADVILNEREVIANNIIMNVKNKEYEEGLITPYLFSPSQHFFSVLEKIKSSELFKYVELMPKGAILHAHDTAISSTDFLIEATYGKNLWVCLSNSELNAKLFKFAKKKPESVEATTCKWKLMSKVREKYGATAVDDYLRESFTLYPKQKFQDNNEAWQMFMNIFGLLDGLLTYAPVWADYYYNALEEMAADGVQYLEFRTTLPKLYDLEDTLYTEMDTVRIYKTTLDRFMKSHPDFIGSKLIYAPLRNIEVEDFDKYIQICLDIVAKYPDFVAGFDLVGQEELGRPLKDFVPQLLSMPENIDFYFHAGETNWYGSSVDENLIDAVLLGTKRIGHGFALAKHPLILQILKERNIAIEVNPISNQVLQLITDFRNHPCSYFFADNYPVVISSDDPSFFKSSPLSHDFYIAFLGIASAHSDIRLLKKLAMNSLQFSSLNETQKKDAIEKWNTQWDLFIELVINGTDNGAINHIGLNRID